MEDVLNIYQLALAEVEGDARPQKLLCKERNIKLKGIVSRYVATLHPVGKALCILLEWRCIFKVLVGDAVHRLCLRGDWYLYRIVGICEIHWPYPAGLYLYLVLAILIPLRKDLYRRYLYYSILCYVESGALNVKEDNRIL